MRILVTGASGFIGGAVVRAAVRSGHTVGVLVRPQSSLRLGDVAQDVQIVPTDGIPGTALARALGRFAPHAIVHAGWFGVAGPDRLGAQVSENVPWSLGIADAARELGCSVLLGFGSQAEYGPQNRVLNEDALPAPMTLYGATKLAVYRATDAVLESSGVRFLWLRVFSSYGPGDHMTVLPYVIRALLAGQRPALTPCEQRWDFVHVDDVAEAAIAALETESARGVFNVGSGEAPVLRDVLEWLRDQIDPTLPLGFGERPYAPRQIMLLQADIGRIVAAVGWKPRRLLNGGLQELIRLERERAVSL